MVLSKTQQEQRSAILEQLYLQGPLSRADLARTLQITPATVTLVTSYMLQEGSIKEQGEALNDAKIGRKKMLLAVQEEAAYYLGVELTASKFFLCITDNLGTLLASTIEPIASQEVHLAQEQLVATVGRFLASHADYPVAAVGIAVPGHYDRASGHIVSNNPFWLQFDMQWLAEKLSLPIYPKNNVKCMALRELYTNPQSQTSNFVFMNLKHGLFASYVYKGEIYGDENHLVGEVGHVVVNPNGEQCEWCGQAGCLQTYASITWLMKKAGYALEAKRAPYLQLLVKEEETLSLTHLLTAYKMGDEVIQELIEQALSYLAVQLHNVQMMLDIDTIYVHGRLFQEPEIVDKLQAKLEQSTTIVQPNRAMRRCVIPYDPLLGAKGAATYAMVHDFMFSSKRG